MTLESLYFLAQILAALAIVGSLVFVGFQIKAQTHEQRQSRVQERNKIILTFFQPLMADAANRDIFIRGLDSFRALSPEDRVFFDSLMGTLARSTLLYHRQYLDGDLPKASWDAYCDYMKIYLGAPGFKEWIDVRGPAVFGPSFGEQVELITGTAEGLEAYTNWRAGMVGGNDA